MNLLPSRYGKTVYERGGPSRTRHHAYVCTKCEKVTGFLYGGLCGRCDNENESGKETRGADSAPEQAGRG